METRTYRPEEDAGRVDALVEACLTAGDQDPLSEGKRLALGARGRGIVMHEDGTLVGFAQLVSYTGHAHPPGTGPHDHPEARWEGEFVVHPAARSRLSDAAAAEVVRTAPGGALLEIWASEPYQAAALRALGWRPVRALHRMEVAPVPDDPAVPPAGFGIGAFVAGRDEEAFLRANHEIFAAHPEQSSWDRAALDDRMSRSWFDAEGFLVARRGDGEVVGFCWTKVHDGEHVVGEIFLIGVVEEARGTGLGRALTAAGLRHLSAVPGVRRAMLYVDGDNTTARAMYEGMGFTVAASKEVYRAAGR
jgi:mycothiol synthase